MERVVERGSQGKSGGWDIPPDPVVSLLLQRLEPALAIAGQLDDFEEEATRERRHPPPLPPSEEEKRCGSGIVSCIAIRILFDVAGSIFDGLLPSGMVLSNMRVAEQTANGRLNPYLRHIGDAMLPLFRLEFAHGGFALQGQCTKF